MMSLLTHCPYFTSYIPLSPHPFAKHMNPIYNKNKGRFNVFRSITSFPPLQTLLCVVARSYIIYLQPFLIQQFNKAMKTQLILTTIIMIIKTSVISATAQLVKYDPFIIQLQFSEVVIRPKFQLILNNFQVLEYTFLTKQTSSQRYTIQVLPFTLPAIKDIERYRIVFNTPLEIGDGRLSTKYFFTDVDKAPVEISFPQAWGIVMLVVAYLVLNFAVFGSVLIEFLEVYCLIIFRSNMNTDLHIGISKGLMLLNPYDQDIQADQTSLSVCLFGPALLILSFGAIGFLIKRFEGKKEKIGHKFAYQVVVYDLFICLSLAFVLPMAFNSIQFFSLLADGTIAKKTALAGFGSFASYIGLITSVALVYLFTYVLNPKPKEEESSWKDYQASEKYLSFRRLHQILYQDRWYTRNKNVFVTIKKILIALCFFIEPGFQVALLLLQFVHIIYIFMVRPFKQELYLNIMIICRILMFIFYGIVICGDVYFYSISHAMLNTKAIKRFLIGREVAFLVICFIILISISYEIYVKWSNFNYRIRLVQEENEYRLKIIERTVKSQDNVKRRRRPLELTTFDDQIRGESSTFDKSQKKFQPRLTIIRENRHIGIQSPKYSSPRRMKTQSNSSRSQSITSRSKSKSKWQKQSLLDNIVREK